MKIFILFVTTQYWAITQEFFDPSACERARLEIVERTNNMKIVAFCTPKRLVKPKEQ